MDVSGITAILYSSHQMLAFLTKTQEFMIDETEAKMMAGAISNVAKHYDGGVMSQQTLDWINLAQVTAVVYGTRIMALRMRKAEERRKQQPAAPADPLGGFQFEGN